MYYLTGNLFLILSEIMYTIVELLISLGSTGPFAPSAVTLGDPVTAQWAPSEKN